MDERALKLNSATPSVPDCYLDQVSGCPYCRDMSDTKFNILLWTIIALACIGAMRLSMFIMNV